MADRIYKLHSIPPSLGMEVAFGEKGSCPVDQTPAQHFNINPETGRPMSDITTILKADSMEADRIIKGLTQYESTFLPDNISDEDALMYYQPRLCQLPSELAELTERRTAQRLKEAQEKAKAEEYAKIREELELSDEKKEGDVESK